MCRCGVKLAAVCDAAWSAMFGISIEELSSEVWCYNPSVVPVMPCGDVVSVRADTLIGVSWALFRLLVWSVFESVCYVLCESSAVEGSGSEDSVVDVGAVSIESVVGSPDSIVVAWWSRVVHGADMSDGPGSPLWVESVVTGVTVDHSESM